MQAISNISQELLEILTEFSDYFFSRDFSHLENSIGKNVSMKEVNIQDMAEEATSMDYLYKAIDKPEYYGFPRHSWGLELNLDSVYFSDDELKQ